MVQKLQTKEDHIINGQNDRFDLNLCMVHMSKNSNERGMVQTYVITWDKSLYAHIAKGTPPLPWILNVKYTFNLFHEKSNKESWIVGKRQKGNSKDRKRKEFDGYLNKPFNLWGRKVK